MLKHPETTNRRSLSGFKFGKLALILTILMFGNSGLTADGCYVCQGSPNIFVQFEGRDTFKKRQAATACGCRVSGTISSCKAANHKILCTLPAHSDQKKAR